MVGTKGFQYPLVGEQGAMCGNLIYCTLPQGHHTPQPPPPPHLKYCIEISIVSPSANPIGDIGSGYPANVYDGNRLSLPILRQKMAQFWCMMFIDLPDGCFWWVDRIEIPGIQVQYQKDNNTE